MQSYIKKFAPKPTKPIRDDVFSIFQHKALLEGFSLEHLLPNRLERLNLNKVYKSLIRWTGVEDGKQSKDVKDGEQNKDVEDGKQSEEDICENFMIFAIFLSRSELILNLCKVILKRF